MTEKILRPSAATLTPRAAIMPLVAANHAEWAPLWRGYLDFYRAAVDATTTETTFARLTSGVEPMRGFLARAGDGAAIGLVYWIVHRSCWTVGDSCYLQDLFVAAGRRGGGVGRLLIDAVVAKARALGCSRVHWLTRETNRATPCGSTTMSPRARASFSAGF
jgi:GNAT superfamily N-acetyltransferase